MSAIIAELRSWIDAHRPSEDGAWMLSDSAIAQLASIADRIDIAHEIGVAHGD